jgi:RNA polymerase sigma-70 factor (ECF subfamily)
MQTNEPSSSNVADLVRCYYAAVARLALSILDDGDEADEAAQETFIAAAKAIDGYRGSASLKTWLFAIAINVCRSQLRRKKAQLALARALAGVQQLFSPIETPEQRTEENERDAALWAAVDRLDEKHRLVVVLRYVHDLTAAEIAQVLAVTEGTVHSRLHYARRKLARQLKQSAVFAEVVQR